jgi:macrolide phosphotransferase
MARSHLTLAALATSAVPALDVVGAAPLGSRDGDVESALLTARDGRTWVVRIPRSQQAESQQSADLVALRALSGGIRSRLPFAVSEFAGQAPVGSTRAIVSEFVGGSPTRVGAMTAELAASVGRAIAAIHSLPTSCVTDAGLPSLGPVHARQETTSVVDRAIATGLLPEALRLRWEAAVEEDRLWEFQPAVVNGALSEDSVLSHDDDVTGVLGWHLLRVADPARDLAWVLGPRRSAVSDAAYDAYAAERSVDRQLRQRATLYAELELARWLLHGVETRSTDTVDDAVRLLHGLVDDVHRDGAGRLDPQSMPVLAVDEVEAMLDRVERAG